MASFLLCPCCAASNRDSPAVFGRREDPPSKNICGARALVSLLPSFRRCAERGWCPPGSGCTPHSDRLDKGLLDFAVLAEEPNLRKYNALAFPAEDVWGLIMPEGDSLSEKSFICFEDLLGLPLFCSAQAWNGEVARWCGGRQEELSLEGSFKLAYNGSVFVREGLGYLLSFDRLVDTSKRSGLCFRPLSPRLTTKLYLVWKKYPTFSPIAERFLQKIKQVFLPIR